tara:strand:- start:85874 stop:87133 length:1260 start_codon:yes stop_codon:yes gene_type:complete
MPLPISNSSSSFSVSEWLTPYAWTPTWAPMLVKAINGYSDQELYPGVNPKFIPFMMDENQHDAYEMATAAQEPIKWGLRYIAVPGLLMLSVLALKATKTCFSRIWDEGIISGLRSNIASFTTALLKLASIFTGVQILTGFIYEHGPKLAGFYENMRGPIHAFTRPFFERILPAIEEVIESEGFVVSPRRMFVGNETNAFLRYMGRIGTSIRTPYNGASIGGAMEPEAYNLGIGAVSQAERFLEFAKDACEAPEQILPSLTSPQRFLAACSKLTAYFAPQMEWLAGHLSGIWTPVKNWTALLAPSSIAGTIANESSNLFVKSAATVAGYVPMFLTFFAGFSVLEYTAKLCGIKVLRGLRHAVLGDVPAARAPAVAAAPAAAVAVAAVAPMADPIRFTKLEGVTMAAAAAAATTFVALKGP